MGFTAIYAFENIILDQLERYFPEAIFYPQFSPFLLAANLLNDQKNADQLTVNFKSDSLEIAVFKNDKFHFYNRFQFETEEEAIYFILLVAQQNEISIANLTTTLSGEINNESNFLQKIKAHIPNAQLIDQQNLSAFYQNTHPAEFSNYFSLLSLHLCA